MRKILTALMFVTLSGIAPVHAAEDCNVAPEAIMNLRMPEYPANATWDSIYGAMATQERFVGGLIVNERVLAVGERFGGKDEGAEIVVADIDSHGQVVREAIQKIPGLRGVNVAVPVKNGFIVTARKRVGEGKSQVWIGFFDSMVKLTRSKEIADSKFALEPQDIVLMQKGGYMLSATAEERSGVHHSVIYKLDEVGNIVRMRAFATGLDNKILSLSAVGNDLYLGAGYMRGDDGRRNGWLVMFNKNAEIVWERQYPRGRGSQINRTVSLNSQYIIAAGESQPAGGGNRAGWVMMVNINSSDIEWQRYYTSTLEYSARDVLAAKGVFSVLLDSNPSEKEDEKELVPAIRLLTVNTRGNVIASDEFLNAQGVHGYRLVSGPNDSRIIIGSTDMTYHPKPPPPPEVNVADEKAGPIISPVKSFQKPAPPEPVPVAEEPPALVPSMDGWVIAASLVPAYKDPCIVVPKPLN